MAPPYISQFPAPLLEDLVTGRWIPIVGSGLSRNATLPNQRPMPLWHDLGTIIASELRGYDYVDPIDSISSYEHEFGRPTLIEKLADIIGINATQPSDVHEAFCSIPFDIVCTTNFDFLLEHQYELVSRGCTPLIGQDQLSINMTSSQVALLKLHGDLRHSERLIVTEHDYDTFLDRFPIIATFLANLLITRTPVLIGYSLNDPDFRQVWEIVGERLGRARRRAYALCVGAQSVEVARYGRRGINVINLGTSKRKYGEILRDTFRELNSYWLKTIVSHSQVLEENLLQQFHLPDSAATNLCYFVLPLSASSFYRYQVFPLIRDLGLVPVTEGDIVSPPGTEVAKQEALLRHAAFVVIDPSDESSLAGARMAVARSKPTSILAVLEEGATSPSNIHGIKVVRRPDPTDIETEPFLDDLERWFRGGLEEIEPIFAKDARRLLDLGESSAAVVSAITYLETKLRERLDTSSAKDPRFRSLRQLIEVAKEQRYLGKIEIRQVLSWLKVRNEIAHRNSPVTKGTAREIIAGVEEIIASGR